MRDYIVCLFVLFFFCNCRHESKFAEIKNPVRRDTLQSLYTETFPLENIQASYVGNLFLKDKSIYFVDSKFCWIFEFDEEGKLKKRSLGQGNGPSELPTGMIDGFACLEDGSRFFVGPSNDCYVFDKHNQLKSKYVMQHRRLKDGEKMNYEDPSVYTLYYVNMIMKNHGDYLYYTVMLDHPLYNFMTSPEEYFKKAHILRKMNVHTGESEAVVGNYPEVYQKDPSLKHLNFVYYDIDKSGNFYITYEGASTIYTFDSNFQPLSAFGYAGRNMAHKEVVFHSIEDFQKGYMKNHEERGLYTGIEYIDETGVLFRTYQRGEGQDKDGLQIYKDRVLIGDVDVPKNFKILGYIPPYYYGTEGIDEENETILIQRFKL